MKYCAHCGEELADEAVICPKCGCAADSSDSISLKSVSETGRTGWDACAIVGFVLSMVSLILYVFNFFGIVPLAGMTVSIVGAVRTYNGYRHSCKLRGFGLAIAGICVGAVLFLFWLAIWIMAIIVIIETYGGML